MQHVLPSAMCVFHQDHSRDELWARPTTNFNSWREICEQGDQRTDRDAWGLAHLNFAEVCL